MADFLQLAHPSVLHLARTRLLEVFIREKDQENVTRRTREQSRRPFFFTLPYFEDDFSVRRSARPYSKLALLRSPFVDFMGLHAAHEKSLLEDVLGFPLYERIDNEKVASSRCPPPPVGSFQIRRA